MKPKKLIFGMVFIVIILGLAYWESSFRHQPQKTEVHINETQEDDLNISRRKIQRELNEPRCSKKTSVFFLKTHKCGSSTVQNIFMRFGRKYQLNFVLPETGNYIGNPETFSPDMIGYRLNLGKGKKYDIFTHHTRYEYSAIKAVMKPEAPFVTIMREPTALQISLYSYYRLNTYFNSSLADLLNAGYTTLQQIPRAWHKIGWNQMAWDLGVSIKEINSPRVIPGLIDKVEAEFGLVMITEYMEASLVLLADLMCWPLEDVRFLILNARIPKAVYRKNVLMERPLNRKETEVLQEINKIDMSLYNHFKKRFKDRILKYGIERMVAQVKQLLALNSKLFSECIQRVSSTKNVMYDVMKYVLKPNAPAICKEVVQDELEFTRQLQIQQEFKIKILNNLKNFLRE